MVAEYNSVRFAGKINMGFVSNDENPFTNKSIKDAFLENNKNLYIGQIVIINFFEFKNADDYTNFWNIN